MTSIIKKRTTAGEVDLHDVRPLSSAPLRKKKNADELLAAAVTAKVEDGNIRLPSGYCAQKRSQPPM